MKCSYDPRSLNNTNYFFIARQWLIEIWKSGKSLTRRHADEQKAQKGCRVRLVSAGEVRVAIGQPETLGEFEVCMFAGEPPIEQNRIEETASSSPVAMAARIFGRWNCIRPGRKSCRG